jgi:hypothetical protein
VGVNVALTGCVAIDRPDVVVAAVLREKHVVVIEVHDEFCPWNRWRVGANMVGRTKDDADLRCEVSVLASVYLGGFSWSRLSSALRLEELKPGAATRADAVFRVPCAPWCPEIF